MTSIQKIQMKMWLKLLRECDKICEQIHLPVQKVDHNRNLKEMNRHYTKENI